MKGLRLGAEQVDRSRWQSWAGLPGVIAAVLPKATCPLCVAAYAGAVSALGLGFLLTDRVLNPMIVVSLVVSVGGVGWNAWQSHQPVPLIMAGAGAVSVILGRMVWNTSVLVYAGVALMVAASLWTLWRRRARSSAIVQLDSEG
jgi:hypothetical protein